MAQGCAFGGIFPMHNLRIHNGDWVVVCDGAKALILENAGDAAALNLKTKEVHAQTDEKTSEQGTDAPGRSINSVGARRSAMEQTDWHEQDEERFLTDLSKRLNAAVMAGEAKSLVLVAPPRALGLIRQAATPNLRKAVRAEIDKDFVKMPVHEIEKHLAA
jgi:protein required for attachment to host cells